MQVQPAFLIAVTGGREADRGVFAAWSDGVIMWSEDSVQGGPPYHMARIDPAEIARTVEEVSRGGRWVGEWRFGPDARWTHISVHAGIEPFIDVGSWHEIVESARDVVATATGVEPLNGRQREEVLASQRADYRTFRARWDSVKGYALSLIPASKAQVEPVDVTRMPW